MELKDRVALVAGGTGLLGTAIARALAGAGADIVITYLERKDAALLALLAVDGATPRGKAASLLWPDVDDDAARTIFAALKLIFEVWGMALAPSRSLSNLTEGHGNR